jgi:hypothetical protein
MNKRAKKRLKKAMGKEKEERAETRTKQNSTTAKTPQQLRGFLPKPEKKRG